MDFIKNILLIDKSAERVEHIKKQLRVISNKISVMSLDSRKNIGELTSKYNFQCLYLNGNIGQQDLFFILRFYTMQIEKIGPNFTIFFSSEDFELLQLVLTEFPQLKIKILHTPLDINDLLEKMQFAIFGKIVTDNKPDKNSEKLKVDLEFINVFITSTKNIIAQMAQIPDLKNSPPMLMSHLKEPLEIAISAKILISSVHFKGSYYIAFPKETFLKFYEIVVMEKCTEINDDNKDFAGELANIIYGQCKKRFSEGGYNLDMVIPSIHLGPIQYSVVILIPFECSIGKFYLAVAPGLI